MSKYVRRADRLPCRACREPYAPKDPGAIWQMCDWCYHGELRVRERLAWDRGMVQRVRAGYGRG